MLLLEFGRELGLPLRGLYFGSHVGWTTDTAKAETMRGAGARVMAYAHSGLSGGYEVSFPLNAEVATPAGETGA